VSERAHALEHSLEVHLPFLQAALGTFRLAPLVVGDAAPDEMAALLGALWGGAETLVVVSSDLSHYLPYDEARERDRRTASAIVALDARLEPEEACGAAPINGLLVLARRLGLEAELLDLRNSGDTAGSRDRVVGYGAFAFHRRHG
jgi:AmmeMemoRadiSam system protein B